MSGNDLTRRSLLAVLAGAGAAGVARPGQALAAALGSPSAAPSRRDGVLPEGLRAPAADTRAPAPRLFELVLGHVGAGVRTVMAPARFDLVGVGWERPASARIELRTQLRSGRWGRWAAASTLGHAPEDRELRRVAGGVSRGAAPSGAPSAAPGGALSAVSHADRLLADPVWVGSAELLQLRCSTSLRGVVLHFVDSGAPEQARAAAMPRAQPVLQTGGGQPPIIARSAWAGQGAHPQFPPEYGAVKLAFVHHTENPNGYSPAAVPAMLRSIFVFHRDVRGWNDIGYNFVVDLFGRIFEARAGGIDEPVVGAQAGGYNAVSSGVAVLGDFQSMRITPAAQRALQHLLAWKLSLHGVRVLGHVSVRVDPSGSVYSRYPASARVTLPRVAGHRDADTTECPGNALYGQLPTLRRDASRIAGEPSSIEMSVGPPMEVPVAPPEGESAPPAGGAEQGGTASGGTAAAASSGATPGAGQPGGTAPGGAGSEVGAGEGGGAAQGGGEQGGSERAGSVIVRQMQLSGRLQRLGGGPIAGATVEVQVRSVSHRGLNVHERTIATAQTGEDGRFSVPLTVTRPRPRPATRKRGRHRRQAVQEHVTALRALCEGGKGTPACVSVPLEVVGSVSAGAPASGPTP